ncbi:hypothetical protein BG004_004447, partial [Podila humilis]
AQAQQWRPISLLYSATTLQYPIGQFVSQLPHCGPLAAAGAVRIVMFGTMGMQTDSACYFNIVSANKLTSEFETTATTTTTVQPTTNPPATSDRSRRTTLPTTTADETSTPVVMTGIDTTPNNIHSTTTSVIITLPTPFTATTLEQTTSGESSPTPTNYDISTKGGVGGGEGTATTARVGHAPMPSGLPLLPPYSPTDGGPGSEGAKSKAAKTISAIVGTVGMAATLAAVILSLLVIRRRRRLQQVEEGGLGRKGAVNGIGRRHGGGRVTKERRRNFKPALWGRSSRSGSGGHFVQMQDDFLDEESACSSLDLDFGNEQEDARVHNAAPTIALHAAMKSEITEAESKDVRQSLQAAKLPLAVTTVTKPPNTFMTSTPMYLRRSSSPRIYSASAYSMSSIQSGSISSFEASSVVRQYWAASVAARAEHRHNHQHYLQSQEESFGQGSSFGERDSESSSRMADIVTHTNDSMGTFATQRQRDRSLERRWAKGLDRRNTLGSSIGEQTPSSSLRRASMLSFSSVPSSMDPEEYQERAYLGRMHHEAMRMQQEHDMIHAQSQPYRQQQQEKYCDHPRRLHYHPHLELVNSMNSRRSSSVPSLTSTNDPFQTFDSNEVLMDNPNPFSDSRAATPVQTGDAFC